MNKTFYLCQQGVPSRGNQDRDEVRKAGTKVHETPCLLLHFQRFDGRKCWGGANRSEALYSLFHDMILCQSFLSIQHKKNISTEAVKMYEEEEDNVFKQRQSCDINCSHIHRWRTTQHIYCTAVPKYNFNLQFTISFLLDSSFIYFYNVRNRSPELQEE